MERRGKRDRAPNHGMNLDRWRGILNTDNRKRDGRKISDV